MKDLFMLNINLKTVQIFVLGIFLSIPLKAQENNIWNSYCGDGSCFENFSCENGEPLVIMMITSYGDHWNGNQLEIYDENDLLINSFTKTVYGANYETAQFCLDDGCYTYNGIESGPWAEEISWVVYDTTGAYLVSEMGTFPSTGTFSVNSSCEEIVSDCTDSLAMNYNSTATVDDGSCEYNCEVYTMHLYDTWGDGWNGAYYTISNEWGVIYENQTLDSGFDGEIEYCLQPDCYVLVSNVGGFNTECSIELIDSQGQTVLDTDLMYGTNSYVISVGNEDCQSIEPIYGCIDPLALNYDSEAEIDSGTCEYGVECPEGQTAINVEVGGGDYPLEVNWEIYLNDELFLNGGSPYSEQVCFEEGICYMVNMYDLWGDTWNGDVLTIGDSTYIGPVPSITASAYAYNTYSIDGACNGIEECISSIDGSYPITIINCEQDSLGCTDPTALNFDPEAIYDDGSCVYVSPVSTEQLISLPSGWSSFSTYMFADGRTMTELLSSVNSIEIVKDYAGNAYLPSWGFDGIGNIIDGQGYQVKTSSATEFLIDGEYMHPEENPIELIQGWNLVAYLRTEGSDAAGVLADLVQEENLVIAKDYLGNAFLPEWAFYGLGEMLPGQAYQLKVNNSDELIYLSNNEEYRFFSESRIDNTSSYDNQVLVTDNNMHIVIKDDTWDVLPKIGSELIAYDQKGNIVGATKYTSPTTILTLWGDDKFNEQKNGLDVNENFDLVIIFEGNKQAVNVGNWQRGSSNYYPNEINIVSSLTTITPNDFAPLVSVWPIPAKNQVDFGFTLYEDSEIEIVLYSILGEKVKALAKTTYKEGAHTIRIDLSEIDAGTYIFEIISEKWSKKNKIQILK